MRCRTGGTINCRHIADDCSIAESVGPPLSLVNVQECQTLVFVHSRHYFPPFFPPFFPFLAFLAFFFLAPPTGTVPAPGNTCVIQ